MKILQWIKNIFKRNKKMLLQEPEFKNNYSWKELYKYKGNGIQENELTLEEKRREQIKTVEYLILYKEEKLLKEEIWEEILENYDENVLENNDMQALITLYKATKYEDMYGDSNIRDFIEEGKYNIVELVNGMIEKAKKEAQIYKDIEVGDFIDGNIESINEIIEELENNKIAEEEQEK